MAGYNWAAGMSNNAVEAYENGLVPASKIRGVPASLVDDFCRPREWHHSSSFYNKTKFYDPKEVRATFGLIKHPAFEPSEKAIAALKEYKEERRASKKSGPEIHTDCTVEWLEWQGQGRRRYPVERKETGCTVSIRGNTVTITLPSGETFAKRFGTNGFYLQTPADREAIIQHLEDMMAAAEAEQGNAPVAQEA